MTPERKQYAEKRIVKLEARLAVLADPLSSYNDGKAEKDARAKEIASVKATLKRWRKGMAS